MLNDPCNVLSTTEYSWKRSLDIFFCAAVIKMVYRQLRFGCRFKLVADDCLATHKRHFFATSRKQASNTRRMIYDRQFLSKMPASQLETRRRASSRNSHLSVSTGVVHFLHAAKLFQPSLRKTFAKYLQVFQCRAYLMIIAACLPHGRYVNP